MKNVMNKFIILSFVFFILPLTGCSKNESLSYKIEEIESEFIDLRFIKEISNDIVIEYKNKLSKEISTSSESDFKIFRLDNDETKEIVNNIGHDDISLIIKPNEVLQQRIPLSKLSPNLKKGTYEIIKKFKSEDNLIEIKFKLIAE